MALAGKDVLKIYINVTIIVVIIMKHLFDNMFSMSTKARARTHTHTHTQREPPKTDSKTVLRDHPSDNV